MKKFLHLGSASRKLTWLGVGAVLALGAAAGAGGLAPHNAQAMASACSGSTLHIDWGGGAHSFYYDDELCGGSGGGGSMHIGM